jgi:hypothetical protein
VTEAPAEPPVRLGPAAANVARAIQPATDAIMPLPPAVGPPPSDDSGGASPEVLKDVAVADQVVDQLRRAGRLSAEDGLTGPLLLDRLSFTPLEGTPFVDLSFTHRRQPPAGRGRG